MSDYPYADRFAINRVLPEKGMSREAVLAAPAMSNSPVNAISITGERSAPISSVSRVSTSSTST